MFDPQALISLCSRLIGFDSGNPPGHTGGLVDLLATELDDPAISLTRHEPRPGLVSLVAVVEGALPGPRVVLNGHLDTFPVGDASGWSVPPLSGAVRDGRIWGRGAGDMRGGVAALVGVTRALAAHGDGMAGQLVLTLVADEEDGGAFGTSHLLAHEPLVVGDCVLNADAGMPGLVYLGEKGVLRLVLQARGRTSHGAHVHLGESAIDTLLAAVRVVCRLRERSCPLPVGLADALAAARRAGAINAAEHAVLTHVTVNVGRIEGGTAANLVAASAEAVLDLRFPPGVACGTLLGWVDELLQSHGNVTREVAVQCEATWTQPSEPVAKAVLAAAVAHSTGGGWPCLRIGATDARLFRSVGMPSVVYGPEAIGMGGVDECIRIADLTEVFLVHLQAAAALLGLEAIVPPR